MKTVIQMIPSATSSLRANATLSEDWNSRLAIETDEAYGFTVVATGNRVYRGSMKVLADETANNAGTRRLLLKVDLPLSLVPTTTPTGNGCCCGNTAETEVPMVSVHTVITVPKQVAVALANGENTAFDHISVGIRVLQNLLGSLCHQQMTADQVNGGVVAEGAVIVKAIPADDDGTVIMPIRYDTSDNRFHLDAGIPSDAPIWGLIGGLRQVSA